MIEVKNLTKRYGNFVAVDNLSFTVETGQIYGFLGPNGAGKSTTMNIMTGYIGATEGQVIIDGCDILDDPKEAKRHIGYLPEIPPLYPDMTVLEYLKFAADLKKIPSKERKAQVEEAIHVARLEAVAGRLINNLSKGYKQRVGLAQAVLGMPDVIILDEPTVGLDPKQIIEIRDVIKSLGKKHTVILSSHIMQEVSAVCDHIMIISHGKLVASDTPEKLMTMMQGSNELSLQVKATATKLKAILNSIGDIEKSEIREKDAICTALITSPADTDIREKLFYACASADCPILEMKLNTKSLEDVFLELTSDKGTDNKKNAVRNKNAVFTAVRKTEAEKEAERAAEEAMLDADDAAAQDADDSDNEEEDE